jgi:hypothetical protein
VRDPTVRESKRAFNPTVCQWGMAKRRRKYHVVVPFQGSYQPTAEEMSFLCSARALSAS